MAARDQESDRVWIQQRSWTPNLDELGLLVSKKIMGALERKSSSEMRPWRSPTASRRCGEEFSLSRRW